MTKNFVHQLGAASVFLASMFFAASAYSSDQSNVQVTVITHVDLLPDTSVPNGVETGIALLKTYVEDARSTGARTAELITWAPTNNHFHIIEIWSSLAAFNAHVRSTPAVTFRNSLQGLIGSPYEQRVYFPLDVARTQQIPDATRSPF